MTDRDFNESDYETLLALDVQKSTPVDAKTLAALPVKTLEVCSIYNNMRIAYTIDIDVCYYLCCCCCYWSRARMSMRPSLTNVVFVCVK
jgi:hypothetical protein